MCSERSVVAAMAIDNASSLATCFFFFMGLSSTYFDVQLRSARAVEQSADSLSRHHHARSWARFR
jgi:hypothetical protein